MANKPQKQEQPTMAGIIAAIENLTSFQEAKDLMAVMEANKLILSKNNKALYDGVAEQIKDEAMEFKKKDGGYEDELALINLSLKKIKDTLDAEVAAGTMTKASISRATASFRTMMFGTKDKKGKVIKTGLLSNMPKKTLDPYNVMINKYYKLLEEAATSSSEEVITANCFS